MSNGFDNFKHFHGYKITWAVNHAATTQLKAALQKELKKLESDTLYKRFQVVKLQKTIIQCSDLFLFQLFYNKMHLVKIIKIWGYISSEITEEHFIFDRFEIKHSLEHSSSIKWLLQLVVCLVWIKIKSLKEKCNFHFAV